MEHRGEVGLPETKKAGYGVNLWKAINKEAVF